MTEPSACCWRFFVVLRFGGTIYRDKLSYMRLPAIFTPLCSGLSRLVLPVSVVPRYWQKLRINDSRMLYLSLKRAVGCATWRLIAGGIQPGWRLPALLPSTGRVFLLVCGY